MRADDGLRNEAMHWAAKQVWIASSLRCSQWRRERLLLFLFLFHLILRRPLIRNAPDHRGVAELLAQIVDRAFGVGGATVQHVAVVGERARAERADAGTH